MKAVTRARLDIVISDAARALGIVDPKRQIVLYTLVRETQRIMALDAGEPGDPPKAPPKTPPLVPSPPRGVWDEDKETPVMRRVQGKVPERKPRLPRGTR